MSLIQEGILDASDPFDDAIREASLDGAFAGRDAAWVDCARCGCRASVKLSKRTGRARCGTCSLDGALLDYLKGCSREIEPFDAPFVEAEFQELKALDQAVERAGDMIESSCHTPEFHLPARTIGQALTTMTGAQIAPDMKMETTLLAQEMGDPRPVEVGPPQSRWVEILIMTVLALVFLGAGLAATALSGFANFQAFRQGVSDPLQGQIWGWSGVIASVCSFGGFTFVWWHKSQGRRKEALQALFFALAGASTSIAGTSMFMGNNQIELVSMSTRAERTRAVIEAQVGDLRAQLAGIPADTRSVAGLQAYIAGVEAAGRTWQKPYRDAQNELGLALRRAELEAQISQARAQLLGNDAGLIVTAEPVRRTLPPVFFAVMLEVFSSQGTSIALVSLLLLHGARRDARTTG